MRRCLISLVALLGLFTTGCDMLTGASILAQTDNNGSLPEDAIIVAKSGQTAASVQSEVSAGGFDRLVINDFAINNAFNGWTQADRNEYFSLMWTQPGCVVVGAVTYTEGLDSTWALNIRRANLSLAALVNERAAAGYPTVLETSWRDAVAANPNLIADDHLHLRTDTAADEYAAAIQRGLSQC